MITLAKLQTYRKFRGDIDGFSRTRGRGDTSDITDADWRLIDELRGGLRIIASGRASPQFAATIKQRLDEVSADEPTRQDFQNLASETKY
jgi:hypothetical protein